MTFMCQLCLRCSVGMELAPTESLGTGLGQKETMSSFDFVVVDVAPFES